MKVGQEGNIKIENYELSINYSLYGQLVELKLNSYDKSCPTFSILDKDLDNNHAVSIELSYLNELNIIIKDFEKKFNQLRIKKEKI